MNLDFIENLTEKEISELYEDSFENYISFNIRYFYVTCKDETSGIGGPAYNDVDWASCSNYTQRVGYCDTQWYEEESGNICSRDNFKEKCVLTCTNR